MSIGEERSSLKLCDTLKGKEQQSSAEKISDNLITHEQENEQEYLLSLRPSSVRKT